MTSTLRTVPCPQCGQLSEWSPANPSRPFCSQRCKLIDLGCWADESYKVPVVEQDEGTDASPEGN